MAENSMAIDQPARSGEADTLEEEQPEAAGSGVMTAAQTPTTDARHKRRKPCKTPLPLPTVQHEAEAYTQCPPAICLMISICLMILICLMISIF